jgi:large subunit ribosomal protein L4
MIRLALRSALSDRAAEGKLIVVDDWGVSEPKTKSGVKLLEGLGLRNVRKSDDKLLDSAKPQRRHGGFERNPRVLLVLFRTEQAVWKSLRNLGDRVQILLPEELNTYDVLLNDWLVFSKDSLDATVARLADGGAGAGEDDDDTSEADTAASEAS